MEKDNQLMIYKIESLLLTLGILSIIVTSLIAKYPERYLEILSKRYQKPFDKPLFRKETIRTFAIFCLIFSLIWTFCVTWIIFAR
jgi:hypothetical protein